MSIFKKLFCSHKWKTHSKAEYSWEEQEVVPGTELFYTPLIQKKVYDSVTEVLVCEHCGKIEIIEY